MSLTLVRIVAIGTLLVMGCDSKAEGKSGSDAEKCPAGERTTDAKGDFADLGYPDGAVACMMGGQSTPSVFFNGVDTEDAALSKLNAFMTAKGYKATTPAASKGDLDRASKGQGSTRVVYTKDGDNIRYSAGLKVTTEGHSVSLSWSRVDCAANAKHPACAP